MDDQETKRLPVSAEQPRQTTKSGAKTTPVRWSSGSHWGVEDYQALSIQSDHEPSSQLIAVRLVIAIDNDCPDRALKSKKKEEETQTGVKQE